MIKQGAILKPTEPGYFEAMNALNVRKHAVIMAKKLGLDLGSDLGIRTRPIRSWSHVDEKKEERSGNALQQTEENIYEEKDDRLIIQYFSATMDFDEINTHAKSLELLSNYVELFDGLKKATLVELFKQIGQLNQSEKRQLTQKLDVLHQAVKLRDCLESEEHNQIFQIYWTMVTRHMERIFAKNLVALSSGEKSVSLAGWNLTDTLINRLMTQIKSFSQNNPPSAEKQAQKLCQFCLENPTSLLLLLPEEKTKLIGQTAGYCQLNHEQIAAISEKAWLKRIALVEETEKVKRYLVNKVPDDDQAAIEDIQVDDFARRETQFDWLKKSVALELEKRAWSHDFERQLSIKALNRLQNPLSTTKSPTQAVKQMEKKQQECLRRIEKEIQRTNRLMQYDCRTFKRLALLNTGWQGSAELDLLEKVLFEETFQRIAEIKLRYFTNDHNPKLLAEITKQDVCDFYADCCQVIMDKAHELKELRFDQQDRFHQILHHLANWAVKILTLGQYSTFFNETPKEMETLQLTLAKVKRNLIDKIGIETKVDEFYVNGTSAYAV